MRQTKVATALCTLLFVVPLSLSYGHGGMYGGPTDTVPPNNGDPTGDTTPPGTPSTPNVPGPGTPSGKGNGPSTGGVPQGGPTTGGMKRGGGGYSTRPNKSSGAYEQWEFWWEANDEIFMELRARLASRPVTSAALGMGLHGPDPKSLTARLRNEERADIRAALLAALKEDDADVVDSAAIALARMTQADDAGEVIAALTRTLGHREKSAREAATLALGIVGSSDSIAVLRELLLDTPEGRRATGHEAGVESLVRSFAAASLGLIGDPAAVDDLRRIVVDDALRADRDAKATAVRALGLVRGAHERIVPLLHQLLDDPGLDRLVRAQAPVALAQLSEQKSGGAAARAALPALVEKLGSDKTDLDLLRSCAVALGRIATLDDGEALDALRHAAAKANDEQTRHFAVMALAEIGRRDPDPAAHADQQLALQKQFVRELLQPKPITATPYGALALAVWARNPRIDRALLADAQEKLHDALLELNNPSFKAAVAVALGVADAKEAREDLLALFQDEKNQVLKSYVAVGLGLMGAREAGEEMRAALPQKGLDSTLRLQMARALGLLGDRQAVPALCENLQTAETFLEVGSTAQALGLIGDRDAVKPLLALLGDTKQAGLRRGFAAVGLGLLAEKSDLPWNAVFTVGSNYRAKTPALAEIFDIL